MSRPLSRQQRLVLEGPGVTLEGVDARDRPVVSARRRWSDGVDRWAVLRSGDPADVAEPVTPAVLPDEAL